MNNEQALTVADYEQAEELWPIELLRRAKNVQVTPTWVEGEDRFWFMDESRDGHEFRLVDAATGSSSPAFAHEVVATALKAEASALPIKTFHYEGPSAQPTALVIVRSDDDTKVRVDLETRAVDTIAVVYPPEFEGPEGRFVFVRDFNLWVRERDGSERALTDDGQQHFAWASSIDADGDGLKRTIHDTPAMTLGLFWSPDGTKVLTRRIDERSVPYFHYLDSVPTDGSFRPVPRAIRGRIAGEPERPVVDWFIIDVASGQRTPVVELPHNLHIRETLAWWTPDSTAIYAAAQTHSTNLVGIVKVTASNGGVEVVHTESDVMWDYTTLSGHAENVYYLPERGEMLWFSHRDGYGHLYAISLDGASEPRQLTSGEWVVADIVRITDSHLFFTATGREAQSPTPYFRHLYRIDLDGGPNANLLRLTPELDADHAVFGLSEHDSHAWGPGPESLSLSVSPSGKYFVDSVSRVDLPPVVNLRNTQGDLIAEVTRADVSLLEEIGYRAPEIFTAKSAGGEFDLYGVILRPRGHDGTSALPVVERIYGGPQTLIQPRSYAEGLNGAFMYGLHSQAEMGFAVVVVDGPGTPYRSKAFRDLTWGKKDRWGIAHHRAAIEGAAKSRPWMDISRVGVCGHSYGGYGTTAALLLEPDFYKVGVSSAAMYDPMWGYSWVIERHFGEPDFGDGRILKNHPAEVAPNYGIMALSTFADNLVGKLAIVYGDLDEGGISPADTLKFIGALTDAGKSYDLIYLPGRDHHHTTEPYHQKRQWDYFIEHLQKREPLAHHRLSVKKGIRMERR